MSAPPKRPKCSHGNRTKRVFPPTPTASYHDADVDLDFHSSASTHAAIQKGASLQVPPLSSLKPGDVAPRTHRGKASSSLPTESLQKLNVHPHKRSRQQQQQHAAENPLDTAIQRQDPYRSSHGCSSSGDDRRQQQQKARCSANLHSSKLFHAPGDLGRDKEHPPPRPSSTAYNSNFRDDFITPVAKPVFAKVPRKKSKLPTQIVNLCDAENSDTNNEEEEEEQEGDQQADSSNATTVRRRSSRPSRESEETVSLSSTIDSRPLSSGSSNAAHAPYRVSNSGSAASVAKRRAPSSSLYSNLGRIHKRSFTPPPPPPATTVDHTERDTSSSGVAPHHRQLDDDDVSSSSANGERATCQQQRPGSIGMKQHRWKESSESKPSTTTSSRTSIDAFDSDTAGDRTTTDSSFSSALASIPTASRTKENATNHHDVGQYASDNEEVTIWSEKPKTTDNANSDLVTCMQQIQSEPYVEHRSHVADTENAASSPFVDADNASSPGAIKSLRRMGEAFNFAASAVSHTSNIRFKSAQKLSHKRKQTKKATHILAGETIRNFTRPDTDIQATGAKTMLDYVKTPNERVTRSKTFSSGGSGHSSFSGMITRPARRKSGGSVIEIASSEDEGEKSSTKRLSKTPQKRVTAGVIRFAIGRKIFHSDCSATFCLSTCTLNVKYKVTQRQSNRMSFESSLTETESLAIDLQEPLEIKYYVSKSDSEPDYGGDELEVTNFLALRVESNYDNGLKIFSNVYRPHGVDLLKKFVVMEFRTEREFDDMRELMQEHSTLQCFLLEENRLSGNEAKDFCLALQTESREEKKLRLGAFPSGPMSRFLIGRGSNDILLVYPFNADTKDINMAAQGLNELNDPSTMSVATFNEQADHNGKAKLDSSSEKENKVETATTKLELTDESRAELELKTASFERLEPGVYLNDTLIDFWCQWIWRNMDKSSVHIFSTLFYTTLESEGASSVMSWTKKRRIDIFKKKFIFIPVNKSLHWSVCVVVNPGAIVDHTRTLHTDDISEDKPFPCLLFFDSLKAHAQHRVAKNVREWLNSEWKRLKGDDEPFTSKTMNIYSPIVPYQDNSWDCGVYVCRYIYAMYKLRGRVFSYRDVAYSQHFKRSRMFQDLITKSSEFEFNAEDIVRIRTEFRILLERLSELYERWKVVEVARQRNAALDRKKVKDEKHQHESDLPSNAAKLIGISNAATELSSVFDSRERTESRNIQRPDLPLECETRIRSNKGLQGSESDKDTSQISTEMDANCEDHLGRQGQVAHGNHPSRVQETRKHNDVFASITTSPTSVNQLTPSVVVKNRRPNGIDTRQTPKAYLPMRPSRMMPLTNVDFDTNAFHLNSTGSTEKDIYEDASFQGEELLGLSILDETESLQDDSHSFVNS